MANYNEPLTISTKTGIERILLQAEEPPLSPVLHRPTPFIQLLGDYGKIILGNLGVDGHLTVNNKTNISTISLDGSTGTLTIKDTTGQGVISINPGLGSDNFLITQENKRVLAFNDKAFGTKAGLFLGAHQDDGAKKPGILAIRNNAGSDSITLDGDAGVSIYHMDGKAAIVMGSILNLPVFTMYNSQGSEIFGVNFNGDISFHNATCKGDIMLANADCAEEFEINDSHEVEPGMVMVLDEYGKLGISRQSYDKKAAGIISGSGDYKPGIVLDKQTSDKKRLPLALMGKVFCMVDATSEPIQAGDLLTTSTTPGHAMKATDPLRAFGAVIGKALRALKNGKGSIPVLVTLQ